MKKRFSEEQIIGFLREAEAGMPVAELCRKHAFSEASYYLWRSKFGGMSVSDAKRLKELEAENTRLNQAGGGGDHNSCHRHVTLTPVMLKFGINKQLLRGRRLLAIKYLLDIKPLYL